MVSDTDLLALAREVFRDRGPSVGTREIASRVGLSQAALLQRFGDRRALLARASSPAPLDIDHLLSPLRDGGDLLEDLVELSFRLHRAIDERLPLIVRLAIASPDASEQVEVAHAVMRVPVFRAMFEAALAERLSATSARRRVAIGAWIDALLNCVHGIVMADMISRRPSEATSPRLRASVIAMVAGLPFETKDNR